MSDPAPRRASRSGLRRPRRGDPGLDTTTAGFAGPAAVVPGSVLMAVQQSAGNRAAAELVRRATDLAQRDVVQRDAAPAPSKAPVDVAKLHDDLFLLLQGEATEAKREQLLRLCLANGGRYEELAAEAKKRGGDLDDGIKRLIGRKKDAARALAYLRYARLRLADKLFIACIEAQTDEDTLWRLLPEASTSLASTAAEFTASYGTEYPADGQMVKKLGSNRLAGLLEDELSGQDLIKGKALLAFGKVRPIDQLRMAMDGASEDECIAAVDQAARSAPAGKQNVLEKEWWETYGTVLGDEIKVHLPSGESSKRAQLMLAGKYTTKELIRLAVEGAGTDWKTIWDALAKATSQEKTDLAKEWADRGEIYTLIDGEWTATAADKKRVAAILSLNDKSGIDDHLTALGLSVDDPDAVIVAALKDDAVEKAFTTAWSAGDFRKRLTDDGRRRLADQRGDTIATGSRKAKVGLAARIDCLPGVQRLLSAPGVTPAERRSIREDADLLERLRKLSGFDQIETLIAPEDPIEKRDWLKSKFERDKSWSSEHSDSAEAYQDEMRELDAAVDQVKDPKHLTDAEKAKLAKLAGSAEGALNTYLQVRNEIDALVIQALSVAAGVLLTVVTGGAGAAVTAELLSAQVAAQVARVAMANALLKVAVTKAVKGDRFEVGSAEGAALFASGAVEGAAMVMATPAALRVLSPEYAAATNAAARKVAAESFEQVGSVTAKTMLEGGAVGATGALFEGATKAGTWKDGFVEGLKSVAGKMLVAGATGAMTAGAIEAVKLTLFSPKGPPDPKSAGKSATEPPSGPAGGGSAPAVPVPAAIDAASAADMATAILTSGEAPWFRWLGLAAQMGEHEAAYRLAFVTARRRIVSRSVEKLAGDLERLGARCEVTGGATLEDPIRVEVVPAPGGKSADLGQARTLVDQALQNEAKMGAFAGLDVSVGDRPAPRTATDPAATSPQANTVPIPKVGQKMKTWGIAEALRPMALKEPVNLRLRSMGVPEINVVTNSNVAHAHFDAPTWTMEINPKYLADNAITEEAFEALIEFNRHEAQHAVQTFQMARWRKMRLADGTLPPEHFEFKIPAEVEAKAGKMQPGDPYEMQAQEWHRSMYGNEALDRQNIYTQLDATRNQLEVVNAGLKALTDNHAEPALIAAAEEKVRVAKAAHNEWDAKYRNLPEERDAYAVAAQYKGWARSGLNARAAQRQLQIDTAQGLVDAANTRIAVLQERVQAQAKAGTGGADVIEAQAQLQAAKLDLAKAESDLKAAQGEP